MRAPLLSAVAAVAGVAMALQPAAAQAASPVQPAVATMPVGGELSPAVLNTPGLNGLRAAEARADLIWQMRAALNVAALQCQFSPFLATVPTYNALLRHHSDELASAFKTMNAYFTRLQGPRAGPRGFDTYATRTNQGWATFDAQFSFCEAAAMVGRRALSVPKGDFGRFAESEIPLMRASLNGRWTTPLMTPSYHYVTVMHVPDPCANRRRCR